MANPPDPPAPPAELARAHELEARSAQEWEAPRGLDKEQLKELHWQGFEMPRPKEPPRWPLVASALVLAFLAAIGYLGWMVLAVSQRVHETERRANEVAEASAREAAPRLALEGVASAALTRAVKGKRVNRVLSAPDLVRTPLGGGGRAPSARGILLWSPSRGVVLSAVNVPAAREGRKHHVWMVTSGSVSRLGLAVPERDGRLTAIFEPFPLAARSTRVFVVTEETADTPAKPGEAVILTSE